jgi:hypothetical protein
VAFGPWGAQASARDDQTTIWPVEAESVEQLFGALAWIPPGVEYTVEGDTELLAFLGKTSARAAEALRTR